MEYWKIRENLKRFEIRRFLLLYLTERVRNQRVRLRKAFLYSCTPEGCLAEKPCEQPSSSGATRKPQKLLRALFFAAVSRLSRRWNRTTRLAGESGQEKQAGVQGNGGGQAGRQAGSGVWAGIHQKPPGLRLARSLAPAAPSPRRTKRHSGRRTP